MDQNLPIEHFSQPAVGSVNDATNVATTGVLARLEISKIVFRRGSARTSRGRAYDTLPQAPYSRLGRGYLLPIPHPIATPLASMLGASNSTHSAFWVDTRHVPQKTVLLARLRRRRWQHNASMYFPIFSFNYLSNNLKNLWIAKNKILGNLLICQNFCLIGASVWWAGPGFPMACWWSL